jgi:hypothetical protein
VARRRRAPPVETRCRTLNGVRERKRHEDAPTPPSSDEIRRRGRRERAGRRGLALGGPVRGGQAPGTRGRMRASTPSSWAIAPRAALDSVVASAVLRAPPPPTVLCAPCAPRPREHVYFCVPDCTRAAPIPPRVAREPLSLSPTRSRRRHPPAARTPPAPPLASDSSSSCTPHCPPAPAAMGNCASAAPEDALAKQRSAEIDKQLEEDMRAWKRECKILLLGTLILCPSPTSLRPRAAAPG